MGDFDDIIKPAGHGDNPVIDVTGKISDVPPKREAKKAPPKGSLLELFLKDGEDAATLADKYNLDPEMSQQVLVPLLNFLDKYEIGSEFAGSPAVQGVGDLASIIGDVAPVIKNAAQYFEGRTQALSEEDEAFLAKIREAQGDGSGLFVTDEDTLSDEEFSFGESVSEDGDAELDAAAANNSYEGPIPITANPFTDGVDWAEVLDGPEYQTQKSAYTYTDMMPEPDMLIRGFEDLARAAGLDPAKVAASDTQLKINSTSESSTAFASGVAPAVKENLSEIELAMEAEKKKLATSSKIVFDTENELMIPENLGTYDPLNVPGFESKPVLNTRLETAEEMAENLGLDLSESEMESEDVIWLNDTEAEEQGYENEDVIEDQTEDLGLDLAEEYYEVIGEGSDDDE
tara:strand:- start:17459 stop:18664 length:1206 start_codon:yes stop_codon:yes gene_type:complete